MLAIILLNKALLDDKTLTQCKLKLISFAEVRAQSDWSEENVLVDAFLLHGLNQFVSNVRELKASGSSLSACNSF